VKIPQLVVDYLFYYSVTYDHDFRHSTKPSSGPS
jgi:hypothetical protein